MYVRPKFEDGTASTLGVSGKLWRDALIMYDRRSKTLWSQIDGGAKAGPRTGERLEKVPSQMTTWANWRARHPDSWVLVKPPLEASPYANYHDKASWVGLPWTRGGVDDRLPKKALVLGLDLEGSVAAVHLESLAGKGLHQDRLAETPLVVFAPDDPRAALVYERSVAGQTLDFRWDAESGSVLVDEQTGSRWNWQTGDAESGPLRGERLQPVPASPIYWSTWVAFYPETAIWPE